MSFNKHFPHRRDPAPRGISAHGRAVLLRATTWVSGLLLVAGYIFVWKFW